MPELILPGHARGPYGGYLYQDAVPRRRTFTWTGSMSLFSHDRQAVQPQAIWSNFAVLPGDTTGRRVDLFAMPTSVLPASPQIVLVLHTGLEPPLVEGVPDPRQLGYGEYIGLPADSEFGAWQHSEWSLSGTFTYTVESEEVFEMVTGDPANGWRQDLTYDGPYWTQLVQYYRVRVGGAVTISASFTGVQTDIYETGSRETSFTLGDTFSDTNTAIDRWVMCDPGMPTATSIPESGMGLVSILTAAAGPSAGPVTLSDEWGNSFEYTYPLSDVVSGIDVSGGVVASHYIDFSHYTTGTFQMLPTRWADIAGRLRAMKDPYPDEGAVVYWTEPDPPLEIPLPSPRIPLDVSGGSFSGSHYQEWAQLHTTAPGVSPYTVSVDSYRPAALTCLFPTTWDLGGRGLIAGKVWDSFTLSHASSLVVEDCSDASRWTADSAIVFSSDGSALYVNPHSLDNYLLRTITAADAYTKQASPSDPNYYQEWGSYRKLRFSVKSGRAGFQPLRVTVYSPYGSPDVIKVWDKHTGPAGEWAGIEIDLCSPSESSALTDNCDSWLPFDRPDGEMWGVDYVSRFKIDGLTPGETYVFQPFSLARSTHGALVDCLGVWFGQTELIPAPDTYVGTDPLRQRMLLAQIDRKQGPEWAYVWMYRGDETIPFTMVNRTLSEMASEANTFFGWVANEETVFPDDGYHNNSLPSYYLEGSGSIWNWGSSEWEDSFDLDVSDGRTLRAQALWDRVSWSWASGNLFNNDGTFTGGNHLPVMCNMVTRGGGHGLVFDISHSSYAGYVVNTTELLHLASTTLGPYDSGSGITDVDGYYQTGTPYGYGNQFADHYVTTNIAAGARTLAERWLPRKWTRGSFRVPRPGQGLHPWVMANEYGRVFMSYIPASTGRVKFFRSVTPGAPWTEQNANVTPADVTVEEARFCRSAETLIMLYNTSDGVVYEIRSRDGGKSWSTPIMVSNGRHPLPVETTFGTLLRTWFAGDSGGGFIKATSQEKGESPSPVFSLSVGPVSAPTPILVQDDSYGIAQSREYAGRLILTVVQQGDNQVSRFLSGDGGKTWTFKDKI